MVQCQTGYTLDRKKYGEPVMIPRTKVALLESIDCDQ
jgi:hypothetical protein